MSKIKPMYLYCLITILFLLLVTTAYLVGNLSLQSKLDPKSNVQPTVSSIVTPTNQISQTESLTYTSPAGAPGRNLSFQYPKQYTQAYDSYIPLCDPTGSNICLYFPQDSLPNSGYNGASFSFWLPQRCQILNNPENRKIGNYSYSISEERPDGALGHTARNFVYQYQGPETSCFQGKVLISEDTNQPLSPDQISFIRTQFEKILQTVTIDFNSIPTSAPTEYNIYKNALDTEQGWKTTSVGTPSLDQCDGHQSQKTTDYLKSFDDKKINWYEKNIGDFEFKSVTGKFGEYHQGITVLYTPNTLGFTNSQELNDFNKCVSGVGEAHPLVATKDRIYWSFVCTGGMGPDDPIDQKNFEDYTKKCEEAYKTVSIIFSGVDNPIPPTSQ